jgi:hypothetical protein
VATACMRRTLLAVVMPLPIAASGSHGPLTLRGPTRANVSGGAAQSLWSLHACAERCWLWSCRSPWQPVAATAPSLSGGRRVPTCQKAQPSHCGHCTHAHRTLLAVVMLVPMAATAPSFSGGRRVPTCQVAQPSHCGHCMHAQNAAGYLTRAAQSLWQLQRAQTKWVWVGCRRSAAAV